MISCTGFMYQPAQLACAALALLVSACASPPTERTKPLPTDETRYAPLIVKALYRDGIAGTSLSALAETEKPIDGDNWFWTDDNAKALEALTLPKIFPDYLTQVGQMVKFIIATSPPPFVFRRRADDRALLKSESTDNFHLATGLMNFRGNLREGLVRQGYRFHDDRKMDAVAFSGDQLGYTVNGKAYTVDVRKTSASEIRKEPQVTVLSHRLELKAEGKPAGAVSYTYRVELNKPYLSLDVEVTAAPGITLKNVEATTSLDQLDALSPVRYSRFTGFVGAGRTETVPAGNAPEPHTLKTGSVQWWTIIQNGNLGDSLAATTLLGNPERLRSIVSTEEHGGVFRHIRSTYDLGTITEQQPSKVSEKKVLLAGGLYNNMALYDRVFSRLDDYPGMDLSISYDIGAELNGVAAAYLADMQRLRKQPGATPVAYEPATRAWFDAIVDGYVANFPIKVNNTYPYIFTRGHSFVILALDTMYLATKDPKYIAQIRRLADVLLEFQVQEGQLATSIKCNSHFCFFDCHAAGIVALARAAIATGDRKYAQAAQLALSSYRTNDEAVTGRQVYLFTGVNPKDTDWIYWIFKAGLLLRSLESLSILDQRGLVRLGRDELEKMADLRKRALQYMGQTAHARGRLIELFTCHKAGETNSETQAWALLGLYPIEHDRMENR